MFAVLNRYDFDNDGFVNQADVRLLLSHVPLANSDEENVAKEGALTRNGSDW